ncbi:Peroxide-responsive repressor PerR [Sedimentisphaera cyanobacteriorum]|uniref:Peroxide-responsive repressor PerR n=1 Tax=Sedimentisphaera cyanobacteriorum TaxID=1940790 RepID=A0A1Q2HR54_9BACT|nr:Fur family transcriptional regulator [Sedimentisphaera cyanobacteriorum]AQQ09726.1 Peroxide-responsive repressor PerR [Sedimentisphaera cyanobacteriorum]
MKSTEEKVQKFIDLCRKNGLRVTPQRVAVYKVLAETNSHPSAEMVHREVRKEHPGISLDTVNRTLLTFKEIGAAFIVEGSGDVRRFDAGLDKHQHMKCVICKKIFDYHYEPFDDIETPENMPEGFKILKKSVYIEGCCKECLKKIEKE